MRHYLRRAVVSDEERGKLAVYFDHPWLMHAIVARIALRWQGRLRCNGTSGMDGRVQRFLEAEKFFCKSAPAHIKTIFVAMILAGVAVQQQLGREVSSN